MKVLLNIFESLLLSFAILLVVLCMTILNKRYVKFILDRTNYYQTVVDKINHDIEYNHYIDKNKVKNDINNYIDNYYMDKEYTNKIETNVNNDLSDYYNQQIKFIGPFNNFRIKKDVIDICTIFVIAIIGLLFMKTKFIHNIDLIFVFSGIIGICISFILYMNAYEGALRNLIKGMYYIYLGINILFVLYPLYSRGYKLIVNKKKIKKYTY